jgi:hypothetical protein
VVGRRFIEMLADMLVEIKARTFNAERFIVFLIVVLQRSREVKKAKDMRNRLTRSMDARQQGKFSMPVQNTERTMESLLSAKQGGLTPSSVPRSFTERCCEETTGDLVETFLRSKHPDARIPKPESLPTYAIPPTLLKST